MCSQARGTIRLRPKGTRHSLSGARHAPPRARGTARSTARSSPDLNGTPGEVAYHAFPGYAADYTTAWVARF